MNQTDPDSETSPDPDRIDASILREKLLDALVPGFLVECDPEEAVAAGAFVEDALEEGDAIESASDLITAVPANATNRKA